MLFNRSKRAFMQVERVEERSHLRAVNAAIMGLPAAVQPMARQLMFKTKMTADEIVAASRASSGGRPIGRRDAP
jgi:hypothetical protein